MANNKDNLIYTVKSISYGKRRQEVKRQRMAIGFIALIANIALVGGGLIFISDPNNTKDNELLANNNFVRSVQDLDIPEMTESLLNTVSDDIDTLPVVGSKAEIDESMEAFLPTEANKIKFSGDFAYPYLDDENWKIVDSVDYDSDGEMDLLWRNSETFASVVWNMQDSEVKKLISLPTLREPDWRIVDVADYNKDGHQDFVWVFQPEQNVNASQRMIWYLKEGEVINRQFLRIELLNDWDWKILGSTDQNQDGIPDLILNNRNPDSEFYNQSLIYQLNLQEGEVQKSENVEPNWIDMGSNYNKIIRDIVPVTAKDFDQDGYIDLVFKRSSTDAADKELKPVFIWTTDEEFGLNKIELPSNYSAEWTPIFIDIDVDGNQDIFWRQQEERQNKIELATDDLDCPQGGTIWLLEKPNRGQAQLKSEHRNCNDSAEIS